MFGGLEIKGSSSSKPPAAAPVANGDANKSAVDSAPAAPSSAFSFLSATGSAAAAPASNDAPPAAAPSAFSFMGGGGGAEAPVPKEEPQEKKETSSVSSAFSFLSQPVEEKQESKPPEETPAPSEETAAGGNSGFSFMSSSQTGEQTASNDSGPSLDAPPAVEKAEPKKSLTSEAPAADLLSTVNSQHPTGSGVVFGGAISKATKKPTMNRRRRTQHIGAGANASSSSAAMGSSLSSTSLPPPSAMPSLPDPSTTSSPSFPGPSSGGFVPPTIDNVSRETLSVSAPDSGSATTADAALEAARRAEEFMQEKMKSSTQFSAPVTPPSYSRSDPTSPQDEDYAEAKAAALEAKAKMAKPSSSGGGFRMGGLFKKKGWGGHGSNTGLGASERNHSWGSSHSGKSIPEPPPHFPSKLASEETAVERLQREQEEVQRAMADRSHSMNQQSVSETPTLRHRQMSPVPVAKKEAPPPPPKPPTPPPPPKKKTPTEKLEDLIQEFSHDSVKAMDRVAHLRQQRQALLEERTTAEKKLLLATQQIAQAEAQQTLAVEEEEFDLADRLAAVMDKWEKEKLELDRILENIGRALKQLNEQRNDVMGGVAVCFRKAQAKLKEFQEDEENTERKGDTDAMQRFSAISKQLSAENERLTKDLKHMERDEELVAEERTELDNAIGEHTASVEKERADAQRKLQTVQDEIEELRERLAAREAVAKQLTTEVEGHDAAIARVKMSFSRQIARVQRKEASVKENRIEWKAERARYESEKEAHDAEVEAHSDALLAHDELMKRLQGEIIVAETVEKIVAKEVVFESADMGSGTSEEDGKLAQIQTKVAEAEAAVAEASQKVKAAEATLEGLTAEKKQLVARIPLLETEKKAAAARRDFKAAGRANKEIKDATSRLKDCEEELNGEVTARVEAANEELKQLEADLETKKNSMNEKEKERGVAAMAELAKKVRHLISTRKEVCGSSSEKNNVRAIGAMVLNGQIKALQKEGEIYGSKFGGWEALMDEIYEQEGDDDSRPPKKETARRPDEDSSAKATAKPDVDGEEAELRKAKIIKFRELTQRLKEAESSLEEAVDKEDYDEAAELDVVFQQIQAGLEELGLTDAEMDEAIAEVEAGGETESRASVKEAKEADEIESKEPDGGAADNCENDAVEEEARPAETEGSDAESPGEDGNDQQAPSEDEPTLEHEEEERAVDEPETNKEEEAPGEEEAENEEVEQDPEKHDNESEQNVGDSSGDDNHGSLGENGVHEDPKEEEQIEDQQDADESENRAEL